MAQAILLLIISLMLFLWVWVFGLKEKGGRLFGISIKKHWTQVSECYCKLAGSNLQRNQLCITLWSHSLKKCMCLYYGSAIGQLDWEGSFAHWSLKRSLKDRTWHGKSKYSYCDSLVHVQTVDKFHLYFHAFKTRIIKENSEDSDNSLILVQLI